MTQVSTQMTQRVGYAAEEDLVAETYQSMCSMGIRHVPVLRNGRLIGIISDRDILLHAEPNETGGVKIAPMRLTEIMTHDVVTCHETDTISHCIDVMLRERIDCLPVLAPNANLVGMITTTDLLKLLRDTDRPPSKHFPFRWELVPLMTRWKTWLGMSR